MQKQVIALAGALARPSITATQMLDSMVASLAADARRGDRRRQRDPRRHRRGDALPGERRRRTTPWSRWRCWRRWPSAPSTIAPYHEWNEHAGAPRPPRPGLHDLLHAPAARRTSSASPRSCARRCRGRSARLISAHRPTVPIYALSPGRETVRRCGLMWGVQAASLRRLRDHRGADRRVCAPRRGAGLGQARRARRDHRRAAVRAARHHQPVPGPGGVGGGVLPFSKWATVRCLSRASPTPPAVARLRREPGYGRIADPPTDLGGTPCR